MGRTTDMERNGYLFDGVYTFLSAYVTNMTAFLVKIDADLGDTAYVTDHAVTTPSIGGAGSKIQATGALQGDIILLCKNIRSEFNDLLDALAADDGVAGTTIFTDEKFASTVNLVDVANARMKQLGEHSDQLVYFFDALEMQFERMLAACDADATITDTDYESTLGLTDIIYPSSSSSSSQSSSSSSSSVSSSTSSNSSSSSSSLSSSSSSSLSSSSSSSSLSSSSSSSSASSSSSSVSSSSSSVSSSSSSSSSRSSSSSSSLSSSSSSSSSSVSSSSSSSSLSVSSSSSSSQSIG